VSSYVSIEVISLSLLVGVWQRTGCGMVRCSHFTFPT